MARPIGITPYTRARMADVYQRGHSVACVARDFRVSVRTVRYHLELNGTPRRGAGSAGCGCITLAGFGTVRRKR